MDTILMLVEFVLHMDKFLPAIMQALGIWTYLALFFVIFMETGFVITPFLPGDSLLFAAGAIAAVSNGGLNVITLYHRDGFCRGSGRYRQLLDRPFYRSPGFFRQHPLPQERVPRPHAGFL